MDADHIGLEDVAGQGNLRPHLHRVPTSDVALEIEKLYEEEATRLLVSLRVGGLGTDTAEDVLHDAFAALQVRMADEDRSPVEAPRLYLWKVVTYLRKRRQHRDRQRTDRERRAQGKEPQQVPDRACEIDDRLELLCLAPELTALTDRQLSAYWYRHALGLSRPEIAETMGIKLPTVDTHLARAAAKFAEYRERSKRYEPQ